MCNPILPLDFLPATPYAIKNGIVLDDSIDLTGYAAMKQLFLLSILILSSEPVFAGWVVVEKQYQTAGLEAAYFDPEMIHRNGNRATLCN